MSVELDWRIDDSDDLDNPDAPQRPATPRPPRAPGRTRGWWLAVLVAICGALAGAAAWGAASWRAWQARVGEEVRSAAQLEARAYAENDAELFMSLQDPADFTWRVHQREWLTERAEWPEGAPYTYTLRVLDVGADGDRAWAEVEETRPARLGLWLTQADPTAVPEPATYRRALFYRRTPSAWVHVAPLADSPFWDETRTRTVGRFTAEFPARDEPLVSRWLEALDAITGRACADLTCPDELHWTLTIVPEESDLDLGELFGDWITDSLALTLPSPSLAGYRVDGLPAHEHEVGLTNMVLFGAIRHSGGRPLFGESTDFDAYAVTGVGILVWETGAMPDTSLSPALDLVWGPIRTEYVLRALRTAFGGGSPEGETQFIPLDRLGAPDAFSPTDDLVIVEIYSLVDYVANVYGRDGLGALLRASARAGSVGEALQVGLGVQDLQAFERDWLAYGRRVYGGAQ